MAIAPGTRVGPYEITAKLGEGGMGEVYRATDTKLKREVAIKVLPAALAGDPERLARFQREAEVLASLNHPNIAAIHGLEEADGTKALVMELVEGPTLEERLRAQGSGTPRALPVDEALAIAKQIAEALEAAHEQGIVHRDLKPANVKVRPDGTVKVLDFGLAKAMETTSAGVSPSASMSPTITTPAMTQAGMILGTAAYMSPEQARGKPVDKRADIWAFGCVLYEMLTARRAFEDEDVSLTLSKVLQREPDFGALPPGVPARVSNAIRLCLRKPLKDRVPDIGSVRLALDGAFDTPPPNVAAPALHPGWRRALPLGVAAALVAGAGVWFTVRSQPGLPGAGADVVRFTVPVGEGGPDGTQVYLGGERDARHGRPSSTSLALSHDGQLLVYAGWEMGPDESTGPDERVESRLYLRRLDQERAVPIDGTEGGSTPFFSPDAAWVGFFAGPSLRRVSVAGGSVETIVSDARMPDQGPRGAIWGDDDTIVYAGRDGLYQVAAGGGNPERVASPDARPGAFRHYTQPHLLPGSRVLLFHGVAQAFDPSKAEIIALDRVTGAETTVLTNAMDPRYIGETRQLLFARDGALMAVGFDPERLVPEGEPVVVLEDVMHAVGMPNGGWETGAAQVAVSSAGHLAYASGGLYPELPGVIVRVSVGGDAEPLSADTGRFRAFGVSPDGDRLVFVERQGRAGSIHVRDLDRGVTRRLDTGGFYDGWPAWSPDGTFIAFSSDREDGQLNVYRMAADGSSLPERLASSDQPQVVSSWSSEGVIAYLQQTVETGVYDIWMIPPGGEPASFFVSDASERYPSFSPDGRWVAYTSDETGRHEVYVRPYPGPGAATLISGSGGEAPAWSRDGTQIYYLERAERMMVVDVRPGPPFSAGRARPLIDPWPYGSSSPTRGYDVLPDGAFITLMDQVPSAPGEDSVSRRRRFAVGEFHVIVNFFEELRRRAGR